MRRRRLFERLEDRWLLAIDGFQCAYAPETAASVVAADPDAVQPAPVVSAHRVFAPDTPVAYLESFDDSPHGTAGDGDFALASPAMLTSRWSTTATNGSGLAQGDATTLTWSIIPDGTPTIGDGIRGLSSHTSDLISRLDEIYGSFSTTPLESKPWFSSFVSVFDRWADLTGLTFQYVTDDGAEQSRRSPGVLGSRGDIRIGGHAIDGDAGVLAYNYYPDIGDMVIDTNDSFFEVTSSDSLGLRNVLAHEIGHGLGLEHVQSGSAQFLMEPFISTNFDGPQLDDVWGAHRHYGDVFEPNDSAATATPLGSLAPGTPLTVGGDARDTFVAETDVAFTSIDDDGDSDFFSFTVSEGRQVDINLDPTGPTYHVGPHGGVQSMVETVALSDLGLELLDTDGTTVLTSADASSAGHDETLSFALPGGGRYFVRVTGDADSAQFYELKLTANTVATTGEISGSKWHDIDGNGRFDIGEPALAGWTIFLDQNQNGLFDDGEPSTLTLEDDPETIAVDETGAYRFPNVQPGDYVVREVAQPGWQQTFPGGTTDEGHTVTVAANDTLAGINFGGILVPTFHFARPASSIEEGNATQSIEVSLELASGYALASAVTVEVRSVGGTATGGGTDYAVQMETLTFPPGSENGATASIDVAVSEDALAEGDETVSLELANPLAPAVLGAINHHELVIADDDEAGISINANPELTTTEAGGVASFEVVLNTQPFADVTIGLASSDTSEGILSRTSATFTPENWSTPQAITITGVDDLLDDGDIGYRIVTSPATSRDLSYDELDAADVAVTNADDEVPGVLVLENDTGTEASEGGVPALYSVVLTSPPSSDVMVVIRGDGQVDTVPTALVFTAANWNDPQPVTVAAIDDATAEGPHTGVLSHAALSSDRDYQDVSIPDVVVSITDNDAPALSMTMDPGSISENGGKATGTITRNTDTTGSLVVQLTSSAASEFVIPGSIEIPAEQASVTFEVVAIDNAIVDTDRVVQISAGAVGHANDVGSLVMIDDDMARFSITPSDGATSVLESGSTDTFDVLLDAQPLSDVVLTIVSDDIDEALVSPSTLRFTPANWNTAQGVTVFGVDDPAVDGNQISTITVGIDDGKSDDAFGALPDQPFAVTTIDDDAPGFTITQSDGSTSVSESGGTDTFDVLLDAQPLSDVVLTVASDDTDEASVSPTTLRFTPANWNTAQRVTVSGVDDPAVDGSQVSSITVDIDDGKSDGAFGALTDQTVAVTTIDDDAPGFTITQSDGSTSVSESGGTDTFDVLLDAQPLSDVVLTIASDDTDEASVSPTTLRFTPANWSTAQRVTVAGVNDAAVDGDQDSTVAVSVDAAASDDSFDALAVQTVSVTTLDDDELTVAIDIKPGSASNPLNPRSAGRIAVGIVSTEAFDAVQLDPESLTFGRTGEEMSLARETEDGAPDIRIEDINGDGRLDSIAVFVTSEMGFHPGDVEGVLRGQMVGGALIEGRDVIRVVGGRSSELVEGEPSAGLYTMDEVWHNWALPGDTNDDGAITALDALMVINSLNRGLGGTLPQLADDAEIDIPFLDNNNDGEVSPLDALLVINRMNRQHRAAVAEAERSASDWSNRVDGAFASETESLGEPTYPDERMIPQEFKRRCRG